MASADKDSLEGIGKKFRNKGNEKIMRSKKVREVKISFWGKAVNIFCQATICSRGFIWQTVAIPINGQWDISPLGLTFIPK